MDAGVHKHRYFAALLSLVACQNRCSGYSNDLSPCNFPTVPVAGNLLKPMLGRGELRCIGATTLDEFRKYIEKVRCCCALMQSEW
jgi:hypothetical protein